MRDGVPARCRIRSPESHAERWSKNYEPCPGTGTELTWTALAS
jgi:hypothetical protein